MKEKGLILIILIILPIITFSQIEKWNNYVKYAKNGHVDSVIKILENDFPKIETKDSTYIIGLPFRYAILNNDILSLQKLIIWNNSNYRYNYCINFSISLSESNKKTILFLLHNGCSFEQDSTSTVPAIYWLNKERNYYFAKNFASYLGKSVNYQIHREKRTILYYALQQRNIKKVQLYLNCGANKQVLDIYGKRPYDYIDEFILLPWRKRKFKELLF